MPEYSINFNRKKEINWTLVSVPGPAAKVQQKNLTSLELPKIVAGVLCKANPNLFWQKCFKLHGGTWNKR